mmetsp:Transcript_7960/g.9109  ORF Transcript_7960/g.9109 Transcript_7960/m.9109 type:complete len:555 (+) Transcript_7960:108-1772(+)
MASTAATVGEEDNKLFSTIGDIACSHSSAPQTVESLCMNCHKTGTTQLLLTVIPFFREVIISSFSCPHCGYRTSEAEPAGEIQEKGGKWTLQVTSKEDFDRHVVKTKYATFRLKELDFEIPAGTGKLTTIEGLLRTALEELQETQSAREKVDVETAGKVSEFISQLALCLAGLSLPVTVELNDPSGNSFIENPSAPKLDPQLKVVRYVRSEADNQNLGLSKENAVAEAESSFEQPKGSTIGKNGPVDEGIEKEVLTIPSDCPNCKYPGNSEMCLTNIPYFKQIMIMAFNCESCGFKDNEVKGGGAISAKGKKICLKVPSKSDDPEAYEVDMRRDVVKGTTAGILIPEIDLEITHGSLGGSYTTLEGLLQLAYDKLFETDMASFFKGDSTTSRQRIRFDEFEKQFGRLLAGDMPFTFVLDDPLDNSFMYSPTAPDPDPRMTTSTYERTKEQNDEFGLSDMNTENYVSEETAVELAPSTMGSRSITGADSGYEPSRTFLGVKQGKVFKLGDSGLGYYDDSVSVKSSIQEHMKDLQVNGSATHPNADVVAAPDVDNM